MMSKLAKRLTLALIAGGVAFGQSLVTSPTTVSDVFGTASKSLPPHVVYRHFLAWVNQLDKDAAATRASDPYQFAAPFNRANLQHQHLDILRDAAHRLDADLQAHEALAQQVIDRYRKEAKEALAQGKALPSAPPEVHRLELQRTALLVHHYVTLRAALGSDVSAQLDRYLNYEFAPHIRLRRIATPVAPAQAFGK